MEVQEEEKLVDLQNITMKIGNKYKISRILMDILFVTRVDILLEFLIFVCEPKAQANIIKKPLVSDYDSKQKKIFLVSNNFVKTCTSLSNFRKLYFAPSFNINFQIR